MKCNLPKTSNKDMQRLREELCKIRCCKCGEVVETHKEPIFAIYEKSRRTRLCKRCKGGAE